MNPYRVLTLIATLILVALGFTASANAAADMPQTGDQIEAINGQCSRLPISTFADWYFFDQSLGDLILDLNRFYNTDACQEARLGNPNAGGWTAPYQSIIWTNVGNNKFTDVQTGQAIDPWNDSQGRVVALRRSGTTAVFAIYKAVKVPTAGRGLKTDQILNPGTQLCGWGGPC